MNDIVYKIKHLPQSVIDEVEKWSITEDEKNDLLQDLDDFFRILKERMAS